MPPAGSPLARSWSKLALACMPTAAPGTLTRMRAIESLSHAGVCVVLPVSTVGVLSHSLWMHHEHSTLGNRDAASARELADAAKARERGRVVRLALHGATAPVVRAPTPGMYASPPKPVAPGAASRAAAVMATRFVVVAVPTPPGVSLLYALALPPILRPPASGKLVVAGAE